MPRQFAIQFRKAHACFYADGEIARLVLDNTAQARRAHTNGGRRNRASHQTLGISAEKLDRLLGRGCFGEQIA